MQDYTKKTVRPGRPSAGTSVVSPVSRHKWASQTPGPARKAKTLWVKAVSAARGQGLMGGAKRHTHASITGP